MSFKMYEMRSSFSLIVDTTHNNVHLVESFCIDCDDLSDRSRALESHILSPKILMSHILEPYIDESHILTCLFLILESRTSTPLFLGSHYWLMRFGVRECGNARVCPRLKQMRDVND